MTTDPRVEAAARELAFMAGPPSHWKMWESRAALIVAAIDKASHVEPLSAMDALGRIAYMGRPVAPLPAAGPEETTDA